MAVDRVALAKDLERFAEIGKEAATLARALRDGGDLNSREEQFVQALIRGARSMEASSKTLLMELKNTT